MLKHLLFLSVVLLSFASCKKDTFEPVPKGYYFVTAKINGVPTAFNTIVGATRGDATRSPNVIFVSGRNGELNQSQSSTAFVLMLNDHAPLTARTYTSGVDPIGAGYSIIEMAPYNSDPGFVVTISSLTAKEIRGSFSGKLKDTAGNSIDVSEGIFFSRIN